MDRIPARPFNAAIAVFFFGMFIFVCTKIMWITSLLAFSLLMASCFYTYQAVTNHAEPEESSAQEESSAVPFSS